MAAHLIITNKNKKEYDMVEIPKNLDVIRSIEDIDVTYYIDISNWSDLYLNALLIKLENYSVANFLLVSDNDNILDTIKSRCIIEYDIKELEYSDKIIYFYDWIDTHYSYSIENEILEYGLEKFIYESEAYLLDRNKYKQLLILEAYKKDLSYNVNKKMLLRNYIMEYRNESICDKRY